MNCISNYSIISVYTLILFLLKDNILGQQDDAVLSTTSLPYCRKGHTALEVPSSKGNYTKYLYIFGGYALDYVNPRHKVTRDFWSLNINSHSHNTDITTKWTLLGHDSTSSSGNVWPGRRWMSSFTITSDGQYAILLSGEKVPTHIGHESKLMSDVWYIDLMNYPPHTSESDAHWKSVAIPDIQDKKALERRGHQTIAIPGTQDIMIIGGQIHTNSSSLYDCDPNIYILKLKTLLSETNNEKSSNNNNIYNYTDDDSNNYPYANGVSSTIMGKVYHLVGMPPDCLRGFTAVLIPELPKSIPLDEEKEDVKEEDKTERNEDKDNDEDEDENQSEITYYRLIIFGGASETGLGGNELKADVWQLSLRLQLFKPNQVGDISTYSFTPTSEWTLVKRDKESPWPLPRQMHSSVYVPSLRQMYTFGGRSVPSEEDPTKWTYLSDLWMLDVDTLQFTQTESAQGIKEGNHYMLEGGSAIQWPRARYLHSLTPWHGEKGEINLILFGGQRSSLWNNRRILQESKGHVYNTHSHSQSQILRHSIYDDQLEGNIFSMTNDVWSFDVVSREWKMLSQSGCNSGDTGDVGMYRLNLWVVWSLCGVLFSWFAGTALYEKYFKHLVNGSQRRSGYEELIGS